MKAYGFLGFAKNIGKIIGRSVSNNVSGKYNTKLMDHAEQSYKNSLTSSSKKSN